jgi:hypothetical protein
MTAFRVTAPATRVGLQERFMAPKFEREVLMSLRIGDTADAQTIVVPVADSRTLATLLKRMATEYRLIVEEAS